MRRVSVVGTSGSGKSTVGRRLAVALGVPYVELDFYGWGPDWVNTSDEQMRRTVAEAVVGDAWVVDGNWAKVRDLIWPRADTIVWLDLSRGRVTWQVTRRTLVRWVRREALWHGNRERLRVSLFTRESIIWWAWSTWPRRRVEYAALLADVEPEVVRLRTRREVDDWLARFE